MRKPWESTNGTIYCPVNGWDCPYYEEHGVCICENVQNECDDFYFMWQDEIDADRDKIKFNKIAKIVFEAISETTGASVKDINEDFCKFDATIDELINAGIAEDEAIQKVVDNWTFDYVREGI